MIQALIFDFDGLILETEEPTYRSWQELYRQFGHEVPLEEWLQTIGTAEASFNPAALLEEYVPDPQRRAALLARRQQREAELIAAQEVLPGVVEYLREARQRGLKVGLASSSTCEWVTGHLERLGLRPYFDILVASDDVPRTKPDPALYRTALERLNACPENALAFEDSLNGLLAAKGAGLRCVVVPTPLTRHLDFSQADLCLESLAAMPLEQLLAYFEAQPCPQ